MKRLSRLLSSAGFRVGVLVIALAAAIWAVVKNWDSVRSSLGQLPGWLILIEIAVSLVYVYLTMVSWRVILNDVGPHIDAVVARRIFFSSQVAKYLPGGVWNFVAAAEIGRDYAISRRRSISALTVSIVVSIVTGLILAALAVVCGPSDQLSDYRWVVLAIPLGVVVLIPPVLNRIVNRAMRILKREPLEDSMSWRGTGLAALYSIAAWLTMGLQLWLMLAHLGMQASVSTFLLSVGGYALGWTAGFLAFFIPAGVGVREVALGAVLSTVVSSGAVVVVVLLSRVFTTIVDVLLGVLASVGMRKGATHE